MVNEPWNPWESTKREALRASKLANISLSKAPPRVIGGDRPDLLEQNNRIEEQLRAGLYGAKTQ